MGGISPKAALRREFAALRKALPRRQELDSSIREKVLALLAYRRAKQVLFYLSAGSEPDTWELLDQALGEGKTVCAPRCLDSEGSMAFYRVTSRQELIPGRFGLWEPDPERCSPAGDVTGALCLVPGLAFDREGFRLGYGKGYYDRFLAGHSVETVGLCYGELLVPRLPRGPFDQRVSCVVTEAGVTALKEERGPGKEGCV